MDPAPTVIIVGGGFGGLYAALALAGRKDHPSVLLIEPRDRFLFLPLLYELLSGELRDWEIAPRYDALLAGVGVAWLQDRVDAIDTTTRQVLTSKGLRIPFGHLVIATGALGDDFGIPGAQTHALGFRTLADVERLQRLVIDLRRRGRPLQRLAIVGGGPTGVELACKLADLVAGATVVELIEQGTSLLPHARAFNREQALLAMRRRDVRVRTGTRVTSVAADHLVLESPGGARPGSPRETLAADGVIWTAGLRFAPPAISPPPACDTRHRLICEPDLRLRGQDRVFVVGDLAAPVADRGDREADGSAPSTDPFLGSLPATAQVAIQQGTWVAGNVMRSLAGDPLLAFQWKDLGEMMSLGRGEACLTTAGFTLAGASAYQLRRLAYLTRLPGLPQQVRAAAAWLAEARV